MAEQHPPVTLGLYGKHPAFGDFLNAGLSPVAQQVLESWLATVMPAIRDGWGEHWQGVFDASPVIRFWYGSEMTSGAGPVCGIMAPSRDKVGRRFPFIVAVSGAAQPAPVIDGDQALYDAMEQALPTLAQGEGGAQGLHERLHGAVGPLLHAAADPIEPGFWAARADGDLARLWGDVSPVDHLRAAALRSYLWCRGAGGGAVHVTRGLPGPEVLAWLMTDAVRSAAPAPDTPPPEPATDERTLPPVATNKKEKTVRPVDMPRLTD